MREVKDVAYTTETPYREIDEQVRAKGLKLGVTENEIARINSKWNRLTKLAQKGGLTGAKYV